MNYWEAIGVIAAHKAGVDPKALRREGIANLRRKSQSYLANFKASTNISVHDKVCSYY